MKKTFRKIFTLLTLVTSITMLCACGLAEQSSQTEPESTTAAIDPAAICRELIDAGVFANTMEENTYIEMLLGISEGEYTSALLYIGTGVTAEKIAIFETTDETTATTLMDKCIAHSEKQLADYISYMPEEADKLTNTITKACGKYVITCVANDYTKAGDIINKYFN